MDFHQSQLAKHCRVCGRRLSKARSRAIVYDCSAHQPGLFTSFGVNLGDDDADTHPPKFCNPCYLTMKRDLKARAEGTRYLHEVNPFTWIKHGPGCQVRGFTFRTRNE